MPACHLFSAAAAGRKLSDGRQPPSCRICLHAISMLPRRTCRGMKPGSVIDVSSSETCKHPRFWPRFSATEEMGESSRVKVAGCFSCEREMVIGMQVHFQSSDCENGPAFCECSVCTRRSAGPLDVLPPPRTRCNQPANNRGFGPESAELKRWHIGRQDRVDHLFGAARLRVSPSDRKAKPRFVSRFCCHRQ